MEGVERAGASNTMLLTEIRNLLTHMEWADALLWRSIRSLPGADDDRSLRERLHHLHTVQWAYLQIWRGQPVTIPELPTFRDLASLEAWARQYYEEERPFTNAVSEADLARPVTLPWAGEIAKRFGAAMPATLGETMLQVVLHTTHHRGQLATKIRELGGEPPLMDFIFWLWTNRPAPEWPPADPVRSLRQE